MVQRALSKPGERTEGDYADPSTEKQRPEFEDFADDEGARGDGLSSHDGSPQMTSTRNGGSAFMGSIFSFRGGDPEVKRREEERKRAAKERAQKAMQRLPRVLQARAWNGYVKQLPDERPPFRSHPPPPCSRSLIADPLS